MYRSFFFLSFFFFPCHEACRILVPRLVVGPELLWWELWVQTAGLTENLRPQGIWIRVRPPRGPHLSTKTQLYPTECKLQCWTSQAKQTVRQEYSTTQQQKQKTKTTKKYVTDEERVKNLQDQRNEDKIDNLPEKEFRVMIVKMIQNLGNRMEKIQETFNKDLEELKSKQTVRNNTIIKIKNTLGLPWWRSG